MSKKNKYIISDACILCKTCYENCPKKAISLDSSNFKYTIDQNLCINCGICYRNCVYRAIDKEDIER